MNISKLYSYLTFASALTQASFMQAATITWTGSGDGSNWLDSGNWDAGLPASGDTVNLSSATIEINGPGATYKTGLNGSGGTININSGGTLTQVGSDFSAIRRFTKINVNDGGTFIVNETVQIRNDLEVFAGGTLEGTSDIRSVEVNMDGTFRPGNSSAGNVYDIVEGGDLILGSNGIIELDILGNGDNEKFDLSIGSNTIGSTLDLSTGTVLLITQGYTPSIGDSFDLWDVTNVNSSITPGDGSNVILSGYTLDLTNWVSSGIVQVAAAAVPEPSTYTILLGLSMLSFLLISRRR